MEELLLLAPDQGEAAKELVKEQREEFEKHLNYNIKELDLCDGSTIGYAAHVEIFVYDN